MNRSAPHRLRTWGLLLLPLAMLYASLFVGRFDISPHEVNEVLASMFWSAPREGSAVDSILLQIRLPRAVLAFVVGAGLAISGAAYQGLFRNPLVSPDVLGATAASAFGAALGLLWSWPVLPVQALAFGCGLAGVLLSWLLSGNRRTPGMLMLVLSGVIVAAFFGALLGAIKYLADPESRLPAITYWLLGSLNGASWRTLAFAVPPMVVGIIALLVSGWQLNALAMGEEEARSLGVRTDRARVLVIIATTLVSAAAVSACGIVGWIGLVIPHLARMITGPDHRRLLPAAGALGAAHLLLMDTLARTLTPGEVPVGILTAVLGAPYFAWLLRRTHAAWQ